MGLTVKVYVLRWTALSLGIRLEFGQLYAIRVWRDVYTRISKHFPLFVGDGLHRVL